MNGPWSKTIYCNNCGTQLVTEVLIFFVESPSDIVNKNIKGKLCRGICPKCGYKTKAHSIHKYGKRNIIVNQDPAIYSNDKIMKIIQEKKKFKIMAWYYPYHQRGKQ